MVPFKGMEILDAAANSILASRPAAHLVIGGDGPCRPGVLRLIESSPHQVRIHAPGKMPRAQVAELLADPDVFVMPSIVHARGRTETPRRPALAATPVALARAVGHLLDDPALRARLALSGRLAAQSRFTWTALARQVFEVYRQLV